MGQAIIFLGDDNNNNNNKPFDEQQNSELVHISTLKVSGDKMQCLPYVLKK